MSSIYIHIPFCKKACYYCSFYFTLSTSQKDKFIDSICKEIELRKNENLEQIKTIYFGGGTPSILSIHDFEKILNAINMNNSVSSIAEISLESNPENLSKDYVNVLKSIGFNRLSIGIQSFFDTDLARMNRNHDSAQSRNAIEIATNIFENVSIDLMFGLPKSGLENWKKNLEIATSFDVKHISTYNLTVEEKTALERKIKEKKLNTEQESTLNDMYFYTLDYLESKGFVNYEISNFGKENYWSQHNLGYWQNVNFLGFGPSAHSYDGQIRRSNISNLNSYLKAIEINEKFHQMEVLTEENKYNEWILTRLRTIFGLSISEIKTNFAEIYAKHFEAEVLQFVSKGLIIKQKDNYTLSREGKVLADYITSHLMI